jgi:hypothetical protein
MAHSRDALRLCESCLAIRQMFLQFMRAQQEAHALDQQLWRKAFLREV